jgi:urea transport system permease protein
VVAGAGLLAFVFGYFAFRSRIKGVYFSIITQALTFAAMLLFFRNETGFGGNNGFTDFKRILGCRITTPEMRMVLFVLTGLALLGFLLLARWLGEQPSSAACCSHPRRRAPSCSAATTRCPTSWHLDVSAVMCGMAGALYVPQVGIINPSEMSPGATRSRSPSGWRWAVAPR